MVIDNLRKCNLHDNCSVYFDSGMGLCPVCELIEEKDRLEEELRDLR